MSLQVSYKKQILFGIMFLVVILLVIEGLATLYEYQFVTDCVLTQSEVLEHLDMNIIRHICNDFRAVEFYFSPYRNLEPNQHFPTINVNEYGFRGPETSKQKPDDTYRIFIIGGSTTFGTGSTSDETTIPGFLQKKFDSANLPFSVEVINAGVSTASSAPEAYMVKEKLINFEPDLLIIYDGYADAKRTIKEHTTIPEKNSLFEFTGNFYKKLKTRAIINSFFTETDYATGKVTYPLNTKEVPEKVVIWKERWKEICELGKEKDFEVMVTVQPVAGTSNRTLSPAAEKSAIRNDYENYVDAFQLYADALVDLNQSCIKTVDLRNIFDGIDDPIYTDYAHMSDFGNEIVAQKMFESSLPIVKQS